MVGWHHRLNGHEFEQALVVGDGQEAWSECCSPWGCKELDTTERLNLLTDFIKVIGCKINAQKLILFLLFIQSSLIIPEPLLYTKM